MTMIHKHAEGVPKLAPPPLFRCDTCLRTKATVDSPSTKLTSEEDAAVSALAATASVDAVADDDVKVKAVDADNEPDNLDSIRDSYVVAMSSDVRKIRGRGRRKVISGSTPVRVGRHQS